MRHRASTGLTALLLVSTPAHAFELWGTGPLSGATVQVTSNFDLRYHHVPDKLEYFEDRNILDYWEEVFRNNFLVTKEGLVIGAQIEFSISHRQSYLDLRYNLGLTDLDSTDALESTADTISLVFAMIF